MAPPAVDGVNIGGTDTTAFNLDVDVIWSELLGFELQWRSAWLLEKRAFASNRMTNLLPLESSPVRLTVYHETLECVWVAHIVRTILLSKVAFLARKLKRSQFKHVYEYNFR